MLLIHSLTSIAALLTSSLLVAAYDARLLGGREGGGERGSALRLTLRALQVFLMGFLYIAVGGGLLRGGGARASSTPSSSSSSSASSPRWS